MRLFVAILLLTAALAVLLLFGLRDDPEPRGEPGPKTPIAEEVALAELPLEGAPAAVEPPTMAAAALTIEQRLERLQREQGISISTDAAEFPARRGYGIISGRAAPEAALDVYRPLLLDELEKYPRGYLRASGLKSVLLCADLAFENNRRAAVPDFETATLYLDVLAGNYAPDYQRCVIHHDYFHMIDYYADGKVYEDASWEKLNAAWFRYGKHGPVPPAGLWSGELTRRYPGFLTHYATTAVQEDKAEVFAHLMMHPDVVAEHAADGTVLAAKVARIKEEARAVSEEMNDEFWKKLAAR